MEFPTGLKLVVGLQVFCFIAILLFLPAFPESTRSLFLIMALLFLLTAIGLAVRNNLCRKIIVFVYAVSGILGLAKAADMPADVILAYYEGNFFEVFTRFIQLSVRGSLEVGIAWYLNKKYIVNLFTQKLTSLNVNKKIAVNA